MEAEAEAPLPPSELETQLPPAVREIVLKPFTGDLDEMVKRRLVRIGVTFNRTFYFVDKGVQRGVAYEYGQLVEERLNKHFKTGTDNKVHVVFVPLPRDMLLPALVEGKVDLVAAQVTVRPELREARRLHQSHADERQPDSRHRRRARRRSPRWTTCPARRSSSASTSSYHQSLLALNEKFKAAGEAAGGDSRPRRTTSRTTTCSRW